MTRWFHPEFETDLIAAAQRLGQQRTGFDRLFLDEAEQAIETVMQAANVISASAQACALFA